MLPWEQPLVFKIMKNSNLTADHQPEYLDFYYVEPEASRMAQSSNGTFTYEQSFFELFSIFVDFFVAKTESCCFSKKLNGFVKSRNK